MNFIISWTFAWICARWVLLRGDMGYNRPSDQWMFSSAL